MKTTIKQKLLNFIKEKEKVRPHELKKEFQISSVAIHKHLRQLLAAGKIVRLGKPPLVFYSLASSESLDKFSALLDEPSQDFLNQRYVYISPTGKILKGPEGFITWTRSLKLSKQLPQLVAEYIKTRQEADKIFKDKPYIEATQKLNKTFGQLALDKIFYHDFYNLPKFGKTKIGSFVLYAKQSQSLPLIQSIAKEVFPALQQIVKEYRIDSIAFIPHSIPRKLQFLKELESLLSLPYPKVEIMKVYSGELQVPQKSLAKLEERIENARNTFFLKKNPVSAKRLLLIDDAIGSGATMNEVAKQIRAYYPTKLLIGWAIAGSYKGFEVIKEV